MSLVLGGQTVQTLTVNPDERTLHKLTLPGSLMGDADLTELQIGVDKTFTPSVVTNGASKDPRELGVRVFHAFVDAIRECRDEGGFAAADVASAEIVTRPRWSVLRSHAACGNEPRALLPVPRWLRQPSDHPGRDRRGV